MIAYNTARRLGLTGSTESIVSLLRSVTAIPINLTHLMELLNFRGMLRKTDGMNGSERWVGTLQNLKAALIALNQTNFVNAYELWFSHVTNPRQSYWDTTNPNYSAQFLSMQINFADQPGMPTTDDFNAVAALGGGRPFISLTVNEYDRQVSDYQNSVTISLLEQRLTSQINEVIIPSVSSGSLSTIVEALRTAASNLEG